LGLCSADQWLERIQFLGEPGERRSFGIVVRGCRRAKQEKTKTGWHEDWEC